MNSSDAREDGPWADPQTHVDTDAVNAPDEEPGADDTEAEEDDA